jgi:hypothetical protein
MKIQIELDDSLLRSAVEQQVGVMLAKFTGEALSKMTAEMVAKKMDRFDPMAAADRAITSAVNSKIENAMEAALGRDWRRAEAIRKLVSDAAAAAVKAVMK